MASVRRRYFRCGTGKSWRVRTFLARVHGPRLERLTVLDDESAEHASRRHAIPQPEDRIRFTTSEASTQRDNRAPAVHNKTAYHCTRSVGITPPTEGIIAIQTPDVRVKATPFHVACVCLVPYTAPHRMGWVRLPSSLV